MAIEEHLEASALEYQTMFCFSFHTVSPTVTSTLPELACSFSSVAFCLRYTRSWSQVEWAAITCFWVFLDSTVGSWEVAPELLVFESLFGGSSRRTQLLVHTCPKNSPLLYQGRSSYSRESAALGESHRQ